MGQAWNTDLRKNVQHGACDKAPQPRRSAPPDTAVPSSGGTETRSFTPEHAAERCCSDGGAEPDSRFSFREARAGLRGALPRPGAIVTLPAWAGRRESGKAGHRKSGKSGNRDLAGGAAPRPGPAPVGQRPRPSGRRPRHFL